MDKRLTIAIDGYSSCGKSSFAKQIAARYKYKYIDSGAMYRAVTLYALRQGIINKNNIDTLLLEKEIQKININFSFNPDNQTNDTFLNTENIEELIRSTEVSNHVSEISAIKFVRSKMVEFQRQIGNEGGIVMDGRDIGTVVFPNAELKIFMIASPDIRSMRRYKELKAKNQEVNLEEIKNNLLHRDLIDSSRAESPLKKADDALVLDNSFMTIDQQMNWIIQVIAKLQIK